MPNEILQSMQQFSGFLVQENQKAEKELKDKKVNLSAQRIARAFEQLGPEASTEDLRKLSFQMIDDAAGLDAIQENQSLISSAYNTTLNTLDRAKQEKQDKAYIDSMTPLARGQNLEGMGAENAGKFTQTYLSQDYQHEELVGDQTYGVRKDIYGKELDRFLVKDRKADWEFERKKIKYQAEIKERYDRLEYKPTGYTTPGPGGLQMPLYTTKQGGHFIVDPVTNQNIPINSESFSKMTTDKPMPPKEQIATIDIAKNQVALDFLTKMGIQISTKKGESPNEAMSKWLTSLNKPKALGIWMNDSKHKATAADWNLLKKWQIMHDQQVAIANDVKYGTDYMNVQRERKAAMSDNTYNNVVYAIDNMFQNPAGENPFGATYNQNGQPVKYSNLALKQSFKQVISLEAPRMVGKDPSGGISSTLLGKKLRFTMPDKEFTQMTDGEWKAWFDNLDDAAKLHLTIRFKEKLPSAITNYIKKK